MTSVVSSHFLIFVVSLSLVYQLVHSEQLIRTNKHGLQQPINKSNRLKLFREHVLTHASSETSRSESIHQGVGQSHIATTHNTLSRQWQSTKHSNTSFFACTPCLSTNSSLTSTPSKKERTLILPLLHNHSMLSLLPPSSPTLHPFLLPLYVFTFRQQWGIFHLRLVRENSSRKLSLASSPILYNMPYYHSSYWYGAPRHHFFFFAFRSFQSH